MKKLKWMVAASFGVPAATLAQALGCLIEPFRVSEVGSPTIGVIDSTAVDRGERVRAGQVLATLRSSVERQLLSVAQSKAEAIGELRAAQANADLARQKLGRAKDLANQQFISHQALEQARAEAIVAENRLTQAREQRQVYAREHNLAQAQLEQRTIRSPISGVVVERYLAAGERVEEKPIYRIAVVNPLRVEVVLPAKAYADVRHGMNVMVTPEFPGAGPRQAKVTLVDRVIDGASNTFRIRLELPNADFSLPAGLRCKADIGGATARQSAPTEPSTRLSPSLAGRFDPVRMNSLPARP